MIDSSERVGIGTERQRAYGVLAPSGQGGNDGCEGPGGEHADCDGGCGQLLGSSVCSAFQAVSLT